jgi:hypothetical protein
VTFPRNFLLPQAFDSKKPPEVIDRPQGHFVGKILDREIVSGPRLNAYFFGKTLRHYDLLSCVSRGKTINVRRAKDVTVRYRWHKLAQMFGLMKDWRKVAMRICT